VSTDEAAQPLTEDEITQLDAAYAPFPPFRDWPSDSPYLERWDISCERFKVAAEEVDEADEEAFDRAREIAMRAAAFDTGAIEGLYSTNRGLTFTVAEQSAAWEQKIEAQGPDARALFEAQLRAFELVLDHVTNNLPEITQAWIRRIHEETTSAQESYVVHTPVGPQRQALPQGEYKAHPNHVRTSSGDIHAYAPVASTQSEMERFLAELQRPEFKKAHPIVKASYVHYAFVAIHPFADGNGRVARALASIFTYREASVPLLILNEHRDTYFEALAQADRGNPQPFVDFIGKVARDGVELVRDVLLTALAPRPEELLHEFDELNRVDPQSRERNEVGRELGEWLVTRARELVEEMDSASVALSVEPIESRQSNYPKAFRPIPGEGMKGVQITAATLAAGKLEEVRRIDLFVLDDPKQKGLLLLQASGGAGDVLVLEFGELWPSPSTLAQQRVDNLIRRTLGDALRRLHNEAIRSIHGSPPSA